MPAINKLISQWRQWINRNKTFTGSEMDELENHLLEEIDDLKQYEGLSEEEAFQKVVSVMGGREALDKEFVKTKPTNAKTLHWVKNHPWMITTALLVMVIVLVSDLVFSSTHFADVYEPISKNYEYKSSENNSYALMTPFTEFKPSIKLTFSVTPNEAISVVPYPTGIASYRITFDISNHGISSDGTVTIVFPKNTNISPSSSDIFETINWETKFPNKMVTEPSLICEANIFFGEYYVILDDDGQLWIEQTSKFTINSTKIDLMTQNLAKNQFILDKSILYGKGLGEDTNSQAYIKYPPSNDDPKLINTKQIDSNQVLLFQKELNGVRTIRLQLFMLPNQVNPILVWDEVKLIRKPIHLWTRLKLSR